MIVYPKKTQLTKINSFFKEKNLDEYIGKNHSKNVNEMIGFNYFKTLHPNLEDLYNLYQTIILNKRITSWEIGCGVSTLIITIALNKLKKKYEKRIINLRKNNPFELFVLDNEKKYLKIAESRINNYYKKIKKKNNIKINYIHSDLQMTTFDGRICTEYKKLPMSNPDFIYLDGPSQFTVLGNINGFCTKHIDLMPMSCDILKIENFLVPGTIILSDGRTANMKFILNHTKRNWIYKRLNFIDQNICYLNETSLGKINSDLLKFFNSKY